MNNMARRPFRILGIQQVAIGGTSKARLRALWVDLFGLELTGTFRSERENVDEDICSLGVGPGRVEVDLMEPIDPDGKPAVHQTPLNHIGLWVDDLPKAVEWLTAKGLRFAPGGYTVVLGQLRNRDLTLGLGCAVHQHAQRVVGVVGESHAVP